MTASNEVSDPAFRPIWRPFLTPSELVPSPDSAFRPVKKKLVCSGCGLTFANCGQLVGHMRVHTGDKPFKCGVCPRAFARNEELTRHRRIHSGDKPHSCDICHKRFGRKDHLNKHRKTHLKDTEKKVHVCGQPGCGHRYTRTDALARHQWTAHAIRRQQQPHQSNTVQHTCNEPALIK
ncbi:zinc finger protein 79-like [Ornithodoros turicata]|uniref:zinc finger protein 79-like n=1 Tax=Ornithodoros turicata TaxID=34597 RepID=UPI0031399A94